MNHRILTDAAKSEVLNGTFLDIKTGVVVASDGIIGAAWKPTGAFIEARVSINATRTHNTLNTLVKLHDADSIGAMEIDLAVLKRALDALMVDGSKDAPIRQATLSIKQPKPRMFVLEIIERTMTSDAGTTLLLMGVTTPSQAAVSALDYLPRDPKPTSDNDTQNDAPDVEVKP